MLLDCCYSGAFARGMITKADKKVITRNDFEREGEGRGRVVLTASDAMQYSFEGDQVGGKGIPSVFTGNLVHGLKTGEADRDADGHITIDELYDYVHDRVVDAMPGQRPAKWNFGVQGRIVIARNPNPVVKPVELPSELVQTMQDMRHWVRGGAVLELERILKGNNKGLALSAQEALKGMMNDDSERVRREVARIMGLLAETQPVKEPEQEKPIGEETDLTSRTGVETEISQPEEKAETRIPIEHPTISLKSSVTTGSARMPTPMLVWLLPAILVPVISGVVVSVVFFFPRQPIVPSHDVETPKKIEKPSEPPEKVEKVVGPEIPKVVEKPKTVEVPTKQKVPSSEIKKMVFRSEPVENLSTESVKSMLRRYNFYCKDNDWNKGFSNPQGSGFQNKFEPQIKGADRVILDHASGLMWQESGSGEYMQYNDVKEYIDRLNREQFAGYSDWRLPTLEEAMTLMEPTENKEGLYIDPLFDGQQRWIWTSDLGERGASSAWVVDFGDGDCGGNDFSSSDFSVRAVR